jgi:Family of unknown function (DUF6111)
LRHHCGYCEKPLRPGLRMIRPIATEIGLFLIPFAVYAAFLLATRAGILHPNAWTLPRLGSLLIASLILMLGSFVALVQFGRAPPGSIYVPAHIEDGKFVPQTYR